MRKQIVKFACYTALLTLTSITQADVSVIVHPSNTASIDENTIKRIFLGKASSFPGGGTSVPVTLKGSVADEFNQKVLGKTSNQLQSYWSKLVFTGKGTPPKEADESEMLNLIANNPQYIGFIPKGTEDSTVKVISSF
jgi:hypothetical protein